LAECSNIGDLSKLSALAEQNRQRGDYVAAEREFSRVLACDPKNAQARNGLDRTRQAKREQQ
jgi:Flp pilus assembly protein TadD